MLINEVVQKFYPIDGGSKFGPEVEELGRQLDRIYNQGGRWNIEGVEPTMGEVAELYDVYKHIVWDGVSYSAITTNSKNVSEILKKLGFKVKEQGAGWTLSEQAGSVNKQVYKVTGIQTVFARTEEDAEMIMSEEDFGDLTDVSWEQDDVEFTADGRGNDRVNVTYIVTGLLEIDVPVGVEKDSLKKVREMEAKGEFDIGELIDTEYELVSSVPA